MGNGKRLCEVELKEEWTASTRRSAASEEPQVLCNAVQEAEQDGSAHTRCSCWCGTLCGSSAHSPDRCFTSFILNRDYNCALQKLSDKNILIFYIVWFCLCAWWGGKKQLQDLLLEACAWEEVLIVLEFCCFCWHFVPALVTWFR